MFKYCYVCGKIIPNNAPYYKIGENSYTCLNNECFNFYYWDNLATKMVDNKNHEYAIINQKVYQIGSENDEPRGFGGQSWTIQFNDGVIINTNSLWYRGELPGRLRHDFKDNAKFIMH